MYIAKQKKLFQRAYILYDFNYMTFFNMKNYIIKLIQRSVIING